MILRSISSYLLLFLIAISWYGCVDQEFDEPPTEPLSELTANTTIAELKAMHRMGVALNISDDIIISGQVVSDDAQGNFYKQLIIEDGTGGISVELNQTELNSIYQRNRVVFVKCKGLTLGNNNGFIQLGLGIDSGGFIGRIPEPLVSQYIERGAIEAPVVPNEVLISNIDIDHVGTLLKLSEVEFSRDDHGQPYAEEANSLGSGTNHILEDCIGGSMILRTSLFADFMNELTPSLNGDVVGVLTVYGNDFQLLIRDVNDVNMTDPPCNRSGGTVELINIIDLRTAFEGGATAVADDRYIKGTVISNVNAGNLHELNMAIQDGSGGIIVRFDSDHSFQPNDILEIDVSAMEMSEYDGLLQINNVPLSRAEFIQAGGALTSNKMTIAELLADFEKFESTLVEIENAEFTSGSTFSGSVDVNDGTGQITMYTRNAAEFAKDALPSGQVTIVAVVTQGGNDETEQISIRTRSDVSGGGTGSGGRDTVDVLFEDFESLNDFDPVALDGWMNVALTGARVWQAKEFSQNVYAQATAYNDNNPNMETWLITPALNLDVVSTLEFESAMAFWNHDGLTVYISTDFDGSNVGSAYWIDLSAIVAGQNDGDHNWIPSGEIDLTAYNGVGYVAFRHIGNSSSATTSYRLDNIDIK
jgi:hypothetical protein